MVTPTHTHDVYGYIHRTAVDRLTDPDLLSKIAIAANQVSVWKAAVKN